jgi:hypothetical protein
MDDLELESNSSVDNELEHRQQQRTGSLDLSDVKRRRRRRAGFQIVRWMRMVCLPFVAILYWVGLWNLLDRYVLEPYSIEHGYVWRDAGYIVLGMGGLFALKLGWRMPARRPDAPFEWGTETLRFTRLYLTVTFAIVFWTGAWNAFDNQPVYGTSAWREIIYIVVATPLLFVLDVVANSKSMRHLCKLSVTKEEGDQENVDDETFNAWG